MKLALINLTKKIILNKETKDHTLKTIRHDSTKLVENILYDTGIHEWEEAKKKYEHLEENTNLRLNSDQNKSLKRIHTNYDDLKIDGKTVEVLGGRIEIITGNFADPKSFEFALYVTLQPFTLIDIIGDSLLVAIGDQSKNLSDGVDTFLLKLNDEYNIKHYQALSYQEMV